MIASLAVLLDDLAAERIAHCLWKSNLRLPQAMAGRTDLDLLIDREHAARFCAVLARHPVKPIVPPAHATYRAMEHYLGFDAPSGRLFHLHVHYQMILGEQFVKNYRIPMETEFLRSTRLLAGVPVPAPALELAVLSVRALLKYRARDFVKDILKIRTPGIAGDIHSEILWLLDQTSPDEVREVLQGAALPPDLIHEFLQIAVGAPRSGFRLVSLRSRLRADLRDMQRQSRVRARLNYLGSSWRGRRRFRITPLREVRMSPSGGGFMVALVGADGAGKSTLAQALADWAGWKLETRVSYMGSKQPSRLSRWLYVAFRAQRRGHRSLSRPRTAAWLARPLRASRDMTLALHHLSIGYDRARRYRAALRDARAGSVVIFDRFPFETLSTAPGVRLLDGPQAAATVDGDNRVATAIAAAEQRMYRRFSLPEQLIVLEVSPSVSARRKPDHPLELLDAKSRAVFEIARLAASRSGSVVARIDADRPFDEVLRDVKARFWDVL